MKLLVALLTTLSLTQAFAAETGFSGESEASVVIVDGNSESETWGAKTKNVYTLENSDNFTIFGKYLKTSTQPVGATEKTETGLNWEAGARYEKSFITDVLNGFIQHKAESDPYNGIFTQRDSTDIGAKYFFTKSDITTIFAEAGVRYSTQNPDYVVDGELKKSTTAGRVYVEGSHKFNEATSAKLWVEHLPNLDDNDLTLTRAEASLSVAMNSTLSLKTAYEITHLQRGSTLPDGSEGKKDSSIWTTALVARY